MPDASPFPVDLRPGGPAARLLSLLLLAGWSVRDGGSRLGWRGGATRQGTPDGAPELLPLSRQPVEPGGWDRLLRRRRPAVLTGVVDRWALMQSSAPEVLRERLGDQWIHALVNRKAGADFGRAFLAGSYIRLRGRDLVDEVFAPPPGPVRLYAWHVDPISFSGEWQVPERIASHGFLPHVSTLWLGQAGSLTGLHYDYWHGFLGQLQGRKRLLLFPPHAARDVYAHRPCSSLAFRTRLASDWDLNSADRYPRLRRARGFEVILEPGEMLYIPPFWWHQARSLDASVSLTARYGLSRRDCLHASLLPIVWKTARWRRRREGRDVRGA